MFKPIPFRSVLLIEFCNKVPVNLEDGTMDPFSKLPFVLVVGENCECIEIMSEDLKR